MNTITLVGNLGRDAESKSVGDKSVVSFSIATSRTVKGEKKTDWHNCQSWNCPDGLIQYLVRGSTVAVRGSLHYREYEKDGVKITRAEINVGEIKLIGGGSDGGRQPNQTPPVRQTNTAIGGAARAAAMPVSDDDVPF